MWERLFKNCSFPGVTQWSRRVFQLCGAAGACSLLWDRTCGERFVPVSLGGFFQPAGRVRRKPPADPVPGKSGGGGCLRICGCNFVLSHVTAAAPSFVDRDLDLTFGTCLRHGR